MPLFTHAGADIFYTVHKPSTAPENEPSNKNHSTPPILLLHGWTCDSHDWNMQIPSLLSRGHTLILADLRGHGRSSAPDTTYSFEELALDISALLQHLDLGEPVIAFGHSLGSVLVHQLAIMSPDLVRALVLVDPVYGREPTPPEIVEQLLSNPAEITIGYFKAVMYTDRSPPWIRIWHERRVLGTPPHVIGRTIWELNTSPRNWCPKESTREILKDIKVPRLAFYGTLLGEDGAEFERSLGVDEAKGDEVVFWQGHGHWLHQEDPERFNTIVDGWLERMKW